MKGGGSIATIELRPEALMTLRNRRAEDRARHCHDDERNKTTETGSTRGVQVS